MVKEMLAASLYGDFYFLRRKKCKKQLRKFRESTCGRSGAFLICHTGQPEQFLFKAVFGLPYTFVKQGSHKALERYNCYKKGQNIRMNGVGDLDGGHSA